MINLSLFAALVALNVADALLTQLGGAHEANPLIGMLMIVCPDHWIQVKVVFTSTLAYFLCAVGARGFLVLGVLVYSLLCCYHAVLIDAMLR